MSNGLKMEGLPGPGRLDQKEASEKSSNSRDQPGMLM